MQLKFDERHSLCDTGSEGHCDSDIKSTQGITLCGHDIRRVGKYDLLL